MSWATRLQVVQEAVQQHSLLPQHHRAAQLVRHVGMRIAQVGEVELGGALLTHPAAQGELHIIIML